MNRTMANASLKYSYNPLLEEDSENRYWGLSDRDVPILIGAAAGSIGLVFLILGAIVIWYCCQFAFKSEKSIYSLDYESERGSITSEGTVPFSDSSIFVGRSTKRETSSASASFVQDVKRSQSALNMDMKKLALTTSRSRSGCGASLEGEVKRVQNRMFENQIRRNDPMRRELERGNTASLSAARTPNPLLGCYVVPGTPLRVANPVAHMSHQGFSRSHLYSPSANHFNDSGPIREIFHLQPTATKIQVVSDSIDEEEDSMTLDQQDTAVIDGRLMLKQQSDSSTHLADPQSLNANFQEPDAISQKQQPHKKSEAKHLNFSKKRKNRMLNDSAAAIAFTKTGNSALFRFHADDTNTLIENESIVVYNERTSL